jgi:C1A family cysteine protease
VDVTSAAASQNTEPETEGLAATAPKPHAYGWVPDIPDQRDYLYAAPAETLAALPPAVDLRPNCPPVYDQGDLNSCTANAIAAAFEFDQMKEKLAKPFMPSRLFIWYNERAIEGTVGSNVGASLRDGIKTVNKQGVCPEDEWPYQDAEFDKKPPAGSFTDALKNRAVTYQRLAQTLTQMKGCLASGFPFVFGFAVYESFESPDVAQSGTVPLPGPTEARLGGHAVVAVGYDDSRQVFIVRNSWGAGWGVAGYCYMPYAYLTQAALANDFWTIRTVTGPAAAAVAAAAEPVAVA